jgi:uncharacterized protein (DUF952 family)
MSNPTFIYKIESADVWSQAMAQGRYLGSPDDLRDGFIHFSTAEQCRITASKYFANRRDLVLAAVPAIALGYALKWEPSRGGALFPHLYAPLDIAHVAWTKPLPLEQSGVHVFPSEMI